MEKIALGVSITASAIGAAAFGYIKYLKSKMKKYVLRNDKIEKYFR